MDLAEADSLDATASTPLLDIQFLTFKRQSIARVSACAFFVACFEFPVLSSPLRMAYAEAIANGGQPQLFLNFQHFLFLF